jgi:sporulation protein YlmC with PRC-barrel domain
MRKFMIPAISLAALAASGFAFAQTTTEQPAANQPTAEQCAADPQMAGCPGTTGNAPAMPSGSDQNAAEQPAQPSDTQTGETTTQPTDTQTGETTTQPSDTQTGQTTEPTDQQQPSVAEQPPVQAPADLTVSNIDGTKAILASNFIGSTVYSTTNENVGDINDLIFDADSKVNAAVIGVGGFLGMGEKDVAVPLDKITMSKDENGANKFVISATREELEAAPAFDKTRLVMGDQAPPAQPTQPAQ